MNTKNQVALCNNLNMNFDEASELFCEESLQSMQMAQINGGCAWWDKFCSWVRSVFNSIEFDTTPQAIPDGKGGFYVPGLIIRRKGTQRPTNQGISYIDGGMNLNYADCNVNLKENSNGDFVFVSGYCIEQTTTPAW